MNLAKNILANWGAHIVAMLVGFFLVPYMLSTIGEAGYGVWVFLNSLVGYSGLMYLGFGATTCRFVAHYRAREEWNRLNQTVSSVAFVYLCAGSIIVLLAAGFALAADLIDRWGDVPLADIRVAIMLLGINMSIGMIGSVYGGVLHAVQRFDLYSGIQVTTALVRLGLTVALLQARHGVVTLAAIFLTVTVIENVLTAILAYRQIPGLAIRPRHVNRSALKECFGFSLFNFFRQMSTQMIYFTDTVVIGFVLGARAVVPYYIGQRLSQMIQTPLEKVGDVVLPGAGEHHARGNAEGLHQLLAKMIGLTLLLAGGFFVGSIYFGGLLITTWTGMDDPASHLVMVILVGVQVVAAPLLMFKQALFAAGRVRATSLIDFSEALLNLGLSLLLIRWWGIIGVAWGTAIPLVLIECCVLLPYAIRSLKLDAKRLLKEAVLPQLPPLTALLVYCEVISRWTLSPGWGPLLAITAGGGVALGAVWLMITPYRPWRRSAAAIGQGHPQSVPVKTG
ncbi:MAG: lipopolysaccharide biosynthesis protein [Maioricimonas sp. JB049]